MRNTLSSVLAPLACVVSTVGVSAHSWVEQMRVISPNGSYTGTPGYMRGYMPRGPGFSDPLNVNLLPPLASGRIRINGSDLMCKSTQQTQNQTSGFPVLSASPGDYVAMRYLENGHVTLPQNQIGKPGSGGTVMVYATTQPKEDELLMDVLKWNTNGTGGNKRGKLLTVQNFDDGRCYQINSSPESIARQAEFPNKPANAPAGTANEEMWCETDIKLPTAASNNGSLTLYWAWQWDTQANMDPGIPNGKDEWYTSCIDVNILSNSAISKAALPQPKVLLVQDPQVDANTKYIDRAANATLPDGGPDGGDGNLGNAVSMSSSSAAAATPASSATISVPVASTPVALAPGAPSSTSTAAYNPAADAPTANSNAPAFGMGITLIPIPAAGASEASTSIAALPTTTPLAATTPATASSDVLNTAGQPHILTLTQVFTITTNYKRDIQTVTTQVVDYAAVRGRNVWA